MEEFFAIGGTEYFDNGISLIEWGELIEPVLTRYIKISFSKDENDLNKRYIKINFKGDFNEDTRNFNF